MAPGSSFPVFSPELARSAWSSTTGALFRCTYICDLQNIGIKITLNVIVMKVIDVNHTYLITL
jgi:hypothetical protein